MTPNQFADWQLEFFNECMAITAKKNNDYSPDSVVLGEVIETAFELGIDVPQALAVHLRKHWSAITTHMSGKKKLLSESISDRLHDAVNYLVFLQFWEVERRSVVTAMEAVVYERTCQCTTRDVFPLEWEAAPYRRIAFEVLKSIVIEGQHVRVVRDVVCSRCMFLHHLSQLR